MAMGTRQKAKDCDEADTISRKARKVLCYLENAKVKHNAKKRLSRRRRREAKRDIKREIKSTETKTP